MFYTKYRPQVFSDIARPNQVADALVKELIDNKTVHAYLFVGPRGTGKTTTARILAKALNCKSLKDNGDPCNVCDVCQAITAGNFIDLIEIDAASHRGIDDIRSIREKISLAPSTGDKKVYIIDEVHMLTTEAFNALLKTLEEPPSHAHFILCTTEFHKVPDTIKSRCQVFKFKRASIDQIVTKLSKIAETEGAKITKSELEKIARSAAGGFRDAETTLQQVIEGGIAADTLLEASHYSDYSEFAHTLVKNDVSSALSTLNKVQDSGIDLYYWIGGFLNYIRAVLFIKSGANSYLESNGNFGFDKADLEKIISLVSFKYIQVLLEKFTAAHSAIKDSYIAQLPIEIVICEICNQPKIKPEEHKTSKPIVPSVEPLAVVVVEETILEVSAPEPVVEEEHTVEEDISLETIQEFWPKVAEKLFGINVSVCTLVKSAKPIGIAKNTINLEVAYAFHKERLEVSRNKLLVEDVISEIYGNRLKISCSVNANNKRKLSENEVGNLTDLNITVPDDKPVSSDQLVSMLDGGLPL